MKRYQLQPNEIRVSKSIHLTFENMNTHSIKKVIVAEGDLISLVLASNKQAILDPVTSQDILDKMIYRGRVKKIELYNTSVNSDHCKTYGNIYLDSSTKNKSMSYSIPIGEYLLDINPINYEYVLDDPEPLVGLEEINICKNEAYPKEENYLRVPIISVDESEVEDNE